MSNLVNKKYNIIVRYFLGSIFFLALNMNELLAHMDVHVAANMKVFNDKTTLIEIQERMGQVSSVIDIEVNDEVLERINQYTYHSRRSAERLLNRVMIYFPVFEKEIVRRGLPDEIKYLAVVESMLDPNAKSKSGATGLWQFVSGTAKMVGLEVNDVIDERKSIEKSTQAAMDYLQSLYDKFGNWNMAFAAYNCGPGNVNKAMRRANNKTDFSEIKKHLPKETQKYLPRFIAAMYLLNYYHHHGFNPSTPNSDLADVVSFPVKNKIRLSQMAKEIGSDYNTLKKLNPQYLQDYIPESKGKYNVRIPASRVGNYYKKFEPELYNKMLLDRANREKEKKAKKEITIKETISLKVDTIQPLEQIVSLIFNSLQSISGKKSYHIPRQMRSLESVLRKV